MNDDLDRIIVDSNEFLSKNKKKYHIYKLVHQHMRDLTEETYQETIQLIQNNNEIFFKDHSSAINFFGFVQNSISSNITRMELIFEILIYFKNEFIRLKVTENEIFSISIQYINYVNFLFQKQLISINTIIEQSRKNPLVFINFLPEIREHDLEYAEMQERGLVITDDKLKNFKIIVEKDFQQHIKNRSINYHPSVLHKSIREDDIDTFQSLLAKNQLSINHRIEYSYYERTQPKTNSNSLIEIATFYRAKKICKYLLLQQDIIFDNDLIPYAYFSYDFDLIHYYEKRNCSLDNVTYMPIYLHQKDLLEYYIENFSDHMSETNETVKSTIEGKFEDDDKNLYNHLTYIDLQNAIASFNYSVIKKVLPKIVFILKNAFLASASSLLVISGYQLDLFKFLYSQINGKNNRYIRAQLENIMIECLKQNMNDAFLFLFSDLCALYAYQRLFTYSFSFNSDMAKYLIDRVIDRNLHYKNDINSTEFRAMFILCNDEIIVKMLSSFYTDFSEISLEFIFGLFSKNLTKKMIISLLEKIPFFTQAENFDLIMSALKKSNMQLYNYYEEKKCIKEVVDE